MPKQKITQTFDGGLAGDVYDWLVPHNMVVDCKNFLFEKGQIQSRPPVRSGASTLGAGTIIDSIMPMFPPVAGSSAQIYGTYKNNQADSTMRLFRIQPLFSGSSTSLVMPPTEAATAVPAGLVGGFYPQCTQFENKTYIHGMYDAANNPILLQVDNGSHVATSITLPLPVAAGNARFRPYPICTHLSRVFVVDPGTPVISFPTVFWSKIGDPTVWTGHFTAGNARLQEADDGIRAMGVMKNMIVMGRPTGFHIGIPTGNGSNPYDWKCLTKNGPGVIYPESFVIFGDLCFFAGQNDIYMFDLETITSIGGGISNEIFTNAQWFSTCIRMFITTGYDHRRTPQLHVLPTYVPSTYTDGGAAGTVPTMDMTNTAHLVYDLNEKKWSRHIYDQAATDPYPLEGAPLTWDSIMKGNPNTAARNTYQRPCLIRRPTNGPSQYMMWDPFAPVVGCESVQNFKTGAFLVGEDASVEGKLCRFMPVIRSSVDNVVVTVNISYMLGNTAETASTTFTIVDSGVYSRFWINKILVGNLFQFEFVFPANSDVQVRQIIFEFETTGQEVRV